jgi:glycosyltransferase involved in cell wall biosynthesis
VREPLHLAVDAHDLARDTRGIGRYVRAVVARFVARDNVRVTLVARAPLAFRFAGPFAHALGTSRVLVRANVPRDADVAWSPWNGTFFTTRTPAVATLHDVAPFAFPATDAARRESQQAPFRRTAASARRILCDSEFTAREVQRYLTVPAEHLCVVPLGVDPVFTPGDTGALPPLVRGRRYVLYVGAHDAHKNVGTLAAAHRAAFAGEDVALVFTRPNPAVPEAIVCAHVDTAALVALYRGALVVAVPSLYEGFGLPVLEAMACGAPVLASRAASLPEVGGDAVAYVDEPQDVGAWRDALAALAGDVARRAELAQRGPERAASFTWDRCAEATLAVLRESAEGAR